MKALGALALAFACFVQCTLGGKPDGNPKSKQLIRGMTAVCYDPKNVCYFHPCQNGGTCSPPKANDGDKPYTCHCFLGFGGVSCEKRQVLLRVVGTKPREVELSVTKSDDGRWAAYITELVNLRNLKPLEHRWVANSGRVTRITLPQLEPGTPYRVRVRPVQHYNQPQIIWIDEATFETPVELKIDDIQERQAVLSVVTSNSTGWSNYTVKITPPKGRERTTTSHQISGNVTEIEMPRLDAHTKYIVHVTPVGDDGTQLREWANEVTFETLPTLPSFTKLPRSVTYFVIGENATIECSASGVPRPTVQWTRSVSPLPQGRSQQTEYGRLNITDMRTQDSGNYTCEASNKLRVISKTTEFVVRPPGNCNFDRNFCGFTSTGMRRVPNGGGSHAEMSGRSGRLEIGIMLNGRSCLSFNHSAWGVKREISVDGKPYSPAMVRTLFGWYQFETHLSGTGKKKMIFEFELRYRVRGGASIDDVRLFDCEEPSFTKVPDNVIHLYIENRIILDCEAFGVPKPRIRWTPGPLPDGRRQQKEGTLSIWNVQVQDSGNYTCTASNGVGAINTTTELLVRESHFDRSVILKDHPEAEQQLEEYLVPVNVTGKRWKLCFRASEDWYSARAFHAACDNKGPTVTLVRVGDNVFGGYTDKSWNGDAGWISSDEAFLFSLRNREGRVFKMVIRQGRQGKAMQSWSERGPRFGGDHDLHIGKNCRTDTISHSNLGYTYELPLGYKYDTPQARSLLAGSYRFNCDEYEVFYRQ